MDRQRDVWRKGAASPVHHRQPEGVWRQNAGERRLLAGSFFALKRRIAAMRKLLLAGLVCLSQIVGSSRMHAFTNADADAIFDAHAKAFYREANGCAWFAESTDGGKASFWMRAEQMEMVLDAFERTTNPQQLSMFTNLFRGFLVDHGTNWGHNPFNDDIMWMVIACVRGNLLATARTNFD